MDPSATANARLALAVAISAALHLSFVYGIGAGDRARSQARPLVARLLPSPPATPAPAKSLPPSSVTPIADVGYAAARPVRSALSPPAVLQPQAPALSHGSEESIASALAVPQQRRDDSLLPKVDVPLLNDPTWYEAKELDRYPSVLTAVKTEYPGAAAADGVTGFVSLLLRIDEAGSVQEATVVAAEPAGYFEASALQAFKTARFSAGQRDGAAVRSQLVIKVRFAPPLQTKSGSL